MSDFKGFPASGGVARVCALARPFSCATGFGQRAHFSCLGMAQCGKRLLTSCLSHMHYAYLSKVGVASVPVILPLSGYLSRV